VLLPLLVRSRKERRDRLAKEQAERALAEQAAKTREYLAAHELGFQAERARAKTRRRRLQMAAVIASLSFIAVGGGVFGLVDARREAHHARVDARYEAHHATRAEESAERAAETAKAETERADLWRSAEEYARRAADEAKAKAARAEKALAEANRQLERSSLEGGKAWLERARTALEKKDPLTAIMLAGRSLGFAGYGREQAAREWQEKFPLLLGGRMPSDPAVGGEQRAAQELVGGIHPLSK
jgi:hypothetical protein